MQKPDLTNVDPEIRAYIEFLEQKLSVSTARKAVADSEKPRDDTYAYTEPPTTINIITFSRDGAIKRTLRHLYVRQHRAGMGVFDIDTSGGDAPSFMACADESQTLLLLSNKARVFRYPVKKIAESPVRAKGQPADRLLLDAGETIVAAIAERASGYLALASQSGYVRCLRHHLFGEQLRPGTSMYHYNEFGPLAAVCWTSGNDDLFLASKNGMGIRFSEKTLPPQGTRGINLAADDRLVAVTAVDSSSTVCLIAEDGKGTNRLMEGFAANKSPGGSGKITMKATQVVAAFAVSPDVDLFILSQQSKIIRFLADEIPSTPGVVQGVNCMLLRNDRVVAAITGTPPG